MGKENSEYRYKEHPKTCAIDDFWGQVSRTINGKPFSVDDIARIETSIRNNLEFTSDDVLLDLGCGNGALAQYFFDDISAYRGVDYSDYLIGIAKDNFERSQTHQFVCDDVENYVLTEKNPGRFSKVLCYGVFSYFTGQQARDILTTVFNRFVGVELLLLGNLPDRNLADQFYHDGIEYAPFLDDNSSSIGIWWSQEDLFQLAKDIGWQVEFRKMGADFCASHYRFDAILRRMS
jgi:cyclopropane fatty-acyl-phospholipid synthase-like methyltransferase